MRKIKDRGSICIQMSYLGLHLENSSLIGAKEIMGNAKNGL